MSLAREILERWEEASSEFKDVKDFEDWMDNEFGVGGLVSYSSSQVKSYMKGLALILEHCGYRELKGFAKLFAFLSNTSSSVFQDIVDAIEHWKY